MIAKGRVAREPANGIQIDPNQILSGTIVDFALSRSDHRAQIAIHRSMDQLILALDKRFSSLGHDGSQRAATNGVVRTRRFFDRIDGNGDAIQGARVVDEPIAALAVPKPFLAARLIES